MTQLIDGRYEVIKPLSSGGFGITHLAKDLRRPGQPRCVVKQLQPQRKFSADGWQVARRLFDQEAEILERLGRHDQIPLLLAHLEENGNFYIVQDFIEGRTLRDELQSVKRLPENEVIALLHQGLTVLSYVHQQGVIHRDIKPENLIRRQDGVLCLIDFGIVKEFSAQQLGRMAQPQAEFVSTAISIGSDCYIPIEQLRGQPCPASDVYAMGMVAIKAVTGRSPLTFDINLSTADIVWQPGTSINPALAEVLTKMVRHCHTYRYANGAEALQALETALALGVPIVVPNPTDPAPQAQLQPQCQQQAPQDDLRSEMGIDYTRLRNLLKAASWRDADNETYQVIVRAMGKKLGGDFTIDQFAYFPCTDLRTIDGLWLKYSHGKFGFSVQRKIYVECGATLDGKYPGEKIWNEFCSRVGWRNGDSYMGYNNLKASRSFSPTGELPTLHCFTHRREGLSFLLDVMTLISLLSHRNL